jgi:hypothetical protein
MIIVKYIIISWLIVSLEPLQLIFERLAEKIGFFNTVFYGVLSCWKCLTFWSLLIVFIFNFDIVPNVLFYAAIGAFIVDFFKRIFKYGI